MKTAERRGEERRGERRGEREFSDPCGGAQASGAKGQEKEMETEALGSEGGIKEGGRSNLRGSGFRPDVLGYRGSPVEASASWQDQLPPENRCGGEGSEFYGGAGGGRDLCSVEFGCHHGNHNGAPRMTEVETGYGSSFCTLSVDPRKNKGLSPPSHAYLSDADQSSSLGATSEFNSGSGILSGAKEVREPEREPSLHGGGKTLRTSQSEKGGHCRGLAWGQVIHSDAASRVQWLN
ncbi:hypothetical protein L3Q82_018604 [Scortum barcoo]|uniref:Uncharacterized protein n=1 Tax=Scortum barcoo TaxID=214431 RepID=A0ACB8VEK5_9TELE|nr:hypothetical protein L3Q82_018604 [Scortum barcoo]